MYFELFRFIMYIHFYCFLMKIHKDNDYFIFMFSDENIEMMKHRNIFQMMNMFKEIDFHFLLKI